MTAIQPQPGIMKIAPYQGGKASLEGVSNVVKLSSNENPLGPSPAAIEAYQRAASDLHRYPSSDHAGLREAIGEIHGLDPARIICGAGSDEVLCFLCQAYAGPGDEIIYTEHGFAMYRIYGLGVGATPIKVREHNRVVDVDAILEAVTPKTRLVFLANPSNPTGTMINAGDVARLAEALPENCLLVLDGAYAEYVEGYDGGAALVEARDNVVMTRTFSKIYGLGALRIGWGYAPQVIIDVLNRMRGPFNVTASALAAAEAAIRDVAYTDHCRAQNAQWRSWLAEHLAELGVPSDISLTNFILARFADAAEADACEAHLSSEGLIVRKVGGYGLSDALRITVGDEAACRRVVDSVRAFKNGPAT
ncbi:MAG: histidinol-phosphate transaminase [Aliishimia sp.]